MKQKLIAGMYGRFKPKPVYPPEQIAREMRAHFKGVFAWTGFCLLMATAAAVWVARSPAFDGTSLVEGYIPLWMGLLSIFFFFFTARYSTSSSYFSYPLCCVYWCFSGFALALLFWAYFHLAIAPLILSSAVSFLLFAAHQWRMKRILQRTDASIAAIVGFLLTAGLYTYFGGHWVDFLLIAIGSFGAVMVIVHCIEMIQRENKIGNAGTEKDMRERVYGSLIVYLHFLLVFAELLRGFRFVAPSKRGSRNSSKSGKW